MLLLALKSLSLHESLYTDGLGYFQDASLAPSPSIPTVFHQLHCFYTIRRAYYTDSETLENFDFGKNRSVHVAHCFDYLQQGLTCSADTTVEPAVDEERGFLGTGFKRQCRDFEGLKEFVTEGRNFDKTGFLALSHHHSG
ncbi:uncharacterized protein N7483_004445 [Penicillium malachiteum]|uniref:uncharacterized protein n=1 Tax=Penicillium malachiteum TaxID=1324776 RepID=UPI0025494B01|nr:uncharacterized protein N7483_004445 [Penicillium malachiteum]KAJ5729937.1 hypothetical protein N7483_004445 [Penicillium malachiteum]